ncbi:uncharacterized protein LOC110460560 [Mizuhopecten yessoensis]|uniref:uncharacterized protein LOC110460560 n=1 Tax=Mizuhopecten yessoensis TaxID=6573 RepID=UPI000B45A4DE|nr:uncharacterized protein LOC110460560 [Mizuhopecten yessoensis]
MTVHIFGNSPSPSVATFGLRKAVETADTDVREFVGRDFYVDNGITSCAEESEAINLMEKTKKSLLEGGNMRLHKIASNSEVVLNAFEPIDLAKNIKDLHLNTDTPPLQRSLGLNWNIMSDTFTFKTAAGINDKPYTRRWVLSVVNSLFDPIGFVAPVVIKGKLLLRNLMSNSLDWDEPLPTDRQAECDVWRESLFLLESAHIPRPYTDLLSTEVVRKEILIFSDASKEAIEAVSYVKIFEASGKHHIGFLLGKANVLSTFMADVTAIVNARPIVPVSHKKTFS